MPGYPTPAVGEVLTNGSNGHPRVNWNNIAFDEKWKQREWPAKRIEQAPRWLAVDLRGEASMKPMNHTSKLQLFRHLLSLGFKEIEIGFPAASQTDFDFCRHLIENSLIPDDVHIQVLTQCREPSIKRTIEAVLGAKNVILHSYSSTSELQRPFASEKTYAGIKTLAIEGSQLIKRMADEQLVPSGCSVRYEYSPESFPGIDLDLVVDVCDAVVSVLAPEAEEKLIINLPLSLEMSTPNMYADQIEWMCAHFVNREKLVLSVQPHNDRGCAVAFAEMAVLAGADRIEGCLFGNGERTGNVCLVTLAINLFSQGIDPLLNFNDIQETIDISESCNGLKLPERWPWAGELVYTAFSGSHQDAIKKGMTKMSENAGHWEVPYLPIDPAHLGRSYEAVVRVNSQSGKGGIAYLLEQEYGIAMPKEAQAEFSQVIQQITDKSGLEITAARIFEEFQNHYVKQPDGLQLLDFEVSTKLVAVVELEKRGITGLPKTLQTEFVSICKPLQDRGDCYQAFEDNFVHVKTPIELIEYETSGSTDVNINATVMIDGQRKTITGFGNGPIDAYLKALNEMYEGKLKLQSYEQHNMQGDARADAICCIAISCADGPSKFGVGINSNTTNASLKACTSSVNRALLAVGKTEEPPEAFASLCSIAAKLKYEGQTKDILGSGNGPISALVSGLTTYYDVLKGLKLLDYSQTARCVSKTGQHSEAVCAIACSLGGEAETSRRKGYGIGLDVNTNTASAKALLSSVNLLLPRGTK